MKKQFLFAFAVLGTSAIACGPVIAISWNEFLIVAVMFAVLLGPPLYRFIRRVEKFLKREK